MINDIKLRSAFAAAILGIMTGVLFTGSASASGDAVKLAKQEWSFKGIFGTFDRGALKRGYQIYAEVCAGCHSLDFVAYRNLQEIGLDEDTVKEIAAEFEVEDGPNDEGEMFMRPARPSDRFVAPFANEKAARASNKAYMSFVGTVEQAAEWREKYGLTVFFVASEHNWLRAGAAAVAKGVHKLT